MLEKIKEAIVGCEVSEIVEYVEEAKKQGVPAKQILDDGLMAGMEKVGKLFGAGELFVPEVLMAAAAMEAGLGVIQDELVSKNEVTNKATLVIGTVKGDLHDIGKKLVAMMIKGAGYNVIDLGVDVPPEKFIEVAKENKAEFIGMSAMLTTTMTEMSRVMELIKEEGMTVKALVGGAPLTAQFADSIGANYSHDAAGAVELINSLM